MRGNLPREVVAHAAGLHQPLERLRVLVQEREIGRAPADRLDDAHQARQHGQSLPCRARLDPRDGGEDSRQQRREASAAELVEPAEVGGLPQLEQHARRSLGIREAGAPDILRDALERCFGRPQRLEKRSRRRLTRPAAPEDDGVEPGGDRLAPRSERRVKRIPVREAHRCGEPRAA